MHGIAERLDRKARLNLEMEIPVYYFPFFTFINVVVFISPFILYFFAVLSSQFWSCQAKNVMSVGDAIISFEYFKYARVLK